MTQIKQAQTASPYGNILDSTKPKASSPYGNILESTKPKASSPYGHGWTPQLSAKFDSNAVKDMQLAILNFAKTLAAHPVMSMQQSGTQEILSAQNGKPLP